MPVRHKLTAAVFGFTVTAILVALPYRLTVQGACPQLVDAAASAKNGNGHGNGKGGGNAGHNGSPGKSNGGNSGNARGAGAGKKIGKQKAAPDVDVNATTGDKVQISGANIRVLHPDGMKETIRGGRYEMNDAEGRTIVVRPATGTDRTRLRRMLTR